MDIIKPPVGMAEQLTARNDVHNALSRVSGARTDGRYHYPGVEVGTGGYVSQKEGTATVDPRTREGGSG